MAHVLITPVTDYTDHRALSQAIGAALAMNPAIPAMLGEAHPRRLVVIKPNWIQQSHQEQPHQWEQVITHPAVVRATLEAVAEAMKGVGVIALCDAPHTYANFEAIIAHGALGEALATLRARFPKLHVELIDLRREHWIVRDDVVIQRRPNLPDPRGYARMNLGRDSLFHGHAGEGHYYGADYDTNVINCHHQGEIQEYLIAGTPMACDLFINLPKLKTHKKTGITCCLKNLVGINGDKNWLPHHTEGGPETGGDEFPKSSAFTRLELAFKQLGRRLALRLPVVGPWLFSGMRRVGMQAFGDSTRTIRNGNWSGNNTCWRMALDLNRALLYGNSDGSWREADAAKAYLAIVDGIVGGEGNGPVCPDPVQSGVLIAGTNPASVDAVAARLMGFPVEAVPLVRHAFDAHRWPLYEAPLSEVTAHDARCNRIVPLQEIEPATASGFTPHFGWQDTLGTP